jgi:hypothetical protein
MIVRYVEACKLEFAENVAAGGAPCEPVSHEYQQSACQKPLRGAQTDGGVGDLPLRGDR